jgi:molybdenum cofactor guanylyltransferase
MQASGFVLAGGASKRMGRAKALLPYRGRTLVEYAAQTVRDAAGSVALIGDPAALGGFGLPVFPDAVPGYGPISGIYTALRVTNTHWNLIVACDMPRISVETLRALLDRAETAQSDCVAATASGGMPEPLCAAYHRRSLPVIERAIQDKRLKMQDLVRGIGATLVPVAPAALANVNTPEEWSEFASPTEGEREGEIKSDAR